MYGVEEVRKAVRNPHVALREVNRMYHRRLWTRPHNTDGIDVFEADWDNLVILDACRYDTFADHAADRLPGTLSKRESRGAATPEFVRGNFTGKRLHDTVYVTSNTWYLKLREEIDAEVHAVTLARGKDASVVTDHALEANDEHPNKRLVVHYIPPHHPFVGPTADRELPPYEDQENDLFERIQRGDLDVSDETLRQAYVENLDRVLPEVETLLAELEGKTVVTADHGELMGDRTAPLPIRDYGHHVGLYVDELVEVPWLEVETDTRKRVVPEEPSDDVEVYSDEEIDQQLRDLGYKV
jgi:hypothetical protein